VYAVPTAGSGAVTPSGPMADPLETLREMLSYCSTWQSWVNASTPTQAEALAHVFYEAVPDAADGDGEQAYTARIQSLRPFVVLWTGGEWTLTRDALSLYQGDGSIAIDIEAEVPSAYRGSDQDDAAMLWFQNQLGALVTELVAQANQAASGGRSYLRIQSVSLEDGPSRADRDRVKTQGDWAGATLMITWGA
jgi:hypothetical protein